MSIAPSQILYLEHGASRLYAEAIQIIENRHLCWARPTLLIQGLPEAISAEFSTHSDARQAAITTAVATPEHTHLNLYDLEGGPDLIWPLELFQIAFDVDFFSLLVQLKINPNKTSQQHSGKQLNEFIHSFWHTNANFFDAQPSELPSIDAL